ncbi:cell division protein ZapA [Verminephrobacter eiseniae]|uniref:cell division protein ZapA n=1 Tax=Verminephrobacter eiseniae TaxID=364317 RepID=UPI002237FFDB|nr:cell division protein ZapA [Verminephrobacter eiseniae]MCW5260717.1 cell division protein ZapA [Verminephrobacter eiseniae]
MKQIEVQILQQSYLLSCPEGHEGRLLDAVERVDSAMTRIRDAGKVRSRERIAVLAALNLAFAIADREAAAPAAGKSGAPAARQTIAPAAGAMARPASLLPADDEQHHLQMLVRRLDQALAADSRLL